MTAIVQEYCTIKALWDFIKEKFMPSPIKKYDAHEFGAELQQYIFFSNYQDAIVSLAELAEKEDWKFKNPIDDLESEYPILESYIKYTYKKLVEEGGKKIVVSKNEEYACWNTGLVTSSQEPIYMTLLRDKMDTTATYWHFGKFVEKSARELDVYGNRLPEMCSYFDDPSILVYDSRKELRIKYEHIFNNEEHFERFPEDIRNGRSKIEIRQLFNSAINNAKEKVKRNYKIAVPQYYQKEIQLLLPLCLIDPNRTDVALVVERVVCDDGDFFYRGNTIFPLQWAYNAARQITKPGNEWLIP